MRIGVSGTHFMGKTTFIRDFVAAHPQFTAIEEAYYELMNEKEVEATLAPSLDGMLQELDYCLDALLQTREQDNVIYDRTPIDYIAYAMCHLQHDESDLADNEIAERFDAIIETMQTLDLLIFVPLDETIDYTEDEPEYRIHADDNFKRLIRDGQYALLPIFNQPRVLELVGDREQRIQVVQRYLNTEA